jgi:outer membrane receptor protein involved in Fe transport
VQGRLQKVVAAMIAASAFTAPAASAHDPIGSFESEPDRVAAHVWLKSWLTLDLRVAGLRTTPAASPFDPPGYERVATAGATLHDRSGWSASLFVTYLEARRAADDEGLQMRASSTVNAQVVRRLSKDLRLTFDVFNVFDQHAPGIDDFIASRLWPRPAIGESFLLHPGEPRGLRLGVRKTF